MNLKIIVAILKGEYGIFVTGNITVFSELYFAECQQTLVRLAYWWWFIFVGVILGTFSNLMAIGLVRPGPSVVPTFKTLDQLGQMLIDRRR